ncbi:MAG: thioesterase [Micromonosporaceae bacterium]|nr:thioesterase [Micromonosporaceae bacterium]
MESTDTALTPGLSATATLTVTEADTAVAMRSGDVPVLATPRVVALAEEATVAAVAGALGPGRTTVGTRVELEHLAPSVLGATVVAQARLDAVDGRRLAFTVSVVDGPTEVARGRVDRVVVERERFLARAVGR